MVALSSLLSFHCTVLRWLPRMTEWGWHPHQLFHIPSGVLKSDDVVMMIAPPTLPSSLLSFACAYVLKSDGVKLVPTQLLPFFACPIVCSQEWWFFPSFFRMSLHMLSKVMEWVWHPHHLFLPSFACPIVCSQEWWWSDDGSLTTSSCFCKCRRLIWRVMMKW